MRFRFCRRASYNALAVSTLTTVTLLAGCAALLGVDHQPIIGRVRRGPLLDKGVGGIKAVEPDRLIAANEVGCARIKKLFAAGCHGLSQELARAEKLRPEQIRARMAVGIVRANRDIIIDADPEIGNDSHVVRQPRTPDMNVGNWA